jgi:hypothetical protein
MMPRSQIAALAVLLVGLGVVLVLVGDTGVSTGVFLPDQPTETVTPTPTPSPTPMPEADAGNWVESPESPGQLTYAPDPAIDAEIVYQTTSYDDMVNLIGLDRPADDDKYPLVTLLAGIRAELESQVSESQLTLDPDGITGPVIEVIEGLPVTTLRVRAASQTTGAGQEFAGLDLVQMFIEGPDGNVTFLQYVLRGEPNPTVYADFRAWLAANIVDITSAGAEATPEATTEAEATAQAEAGPTQAAPEGTTPEATTEAQVTLEATQEAPQGPIPTAETAVTPGATLEATVEAQVTLEATQEAPPSPEPTAETGAAEPAEKWIETTPGQVAYALNPNAGIMYAAAPLDQFATGTGIEMTEGATLPTAEEILTIVRTDIEAELQAGAIVVEEGNFEGPTTEDINGVPFTYLRVAAQAQTTPDGQALPAQEIVIGIIETGENRITVIRFISQGDLNPAAYADFREWLAQNMTRLAQLEITETSGQ